LVWWHLRHGTEEEVGDLIEIRDKLADLGLKDEAANIDQVIFDVVGGEAG
jgi:hypothetical protein